MAPRPRSSIRGLGGLDADIEQSIADTRARNEAQLLGMPAPTLDVNPEHSVTNPSFSLTPDQQRNAGSSTLLDPVAVMELRQQPVRGYLSGDYGTSDSHANGVTSGEPKWNLDPAYLAELEYWADINDQNGPLQVEITRGANDLPNTSGIGGVLPTAGRYAVGGAEAVLSGAYNYGVRLAGGLASIPYLLDSVDAAVAVQEGFAERYNYNVRSQGAQAIGTALQPVGQYVQNNILNPLRNYSEARIGDAATTALFSGARAAAEIGGVLITGGATRVFSARSPQISSVRAVSADIENLKFRGGDPRYEPPYASGTRPRDFVTASDLDFVRVHVGVERQVGSFVARREEISGLTPGQIRSTFGLADVPTYVSDVRVPAGVSMRVSRAGAQPRLGVPDNGGFQYEILGTRMPQWFYNARPIGNVFE